MDPNTLDIVLSLSLTILVVATLIAIFFTSLLSCLRRRNHSPDHPTPPTSADHDDLLAGIPIVIYGLSPQPSSKLPTSPPSTASFDSNDCSICLGEFGPGEEVRVLPKCSHMFHRVCIDQWLPAKSLHCPVCRDRAIEESVEENNVEGSRRMNCRNNRNNGNENVSPSASLAITFSITALRPASNL